MQRSHVVGKPQLAKRGTQNVRSTKTHLMTPNKPTVRAHEYRSYLKRNPK